MILSELLKRVKYRCDGNTDITVNGVSSNSVYTEKGDLFIAVPDRNGRWLKHIAEAVEKGAAAVLCERLPFDFNVISQDPSCFGVTEDTGMLSGICESEYGADSTGRVLFILCENCRRAAAFVYSELNGNPQDHMITVGITGTNGKTSTSAVLKSILKSAGEKCGIIGTLGAFADGVRIESGESELESSCAAMTTPDAKYLYSILKQIKEAGCTYCIIEVSSHALALNKVDAISFDLGILTNLAEDHLDFHKSIDEYCDAKCRLASMSKAVLAQDDRYGYRFVKVSDNSRLFSVKDFASEDEADTKRQIEGNNLSVGIKAENTKKSVSAVKTKIKKADNNKFNIQQIIIKPDLFYGENVTAYGENGCEYTFVHGAVRTRIKSPMKGKFAVYNTLCAASASVMLGIEDEYIMMGTEALTGVNGRFEIILNHPPYPVVIIDYAHTAEAMKMLLLDMRKIYSDKKIITVFGAGGEREKEKRTEMGRIACRYADYSYITGDNPRSENPLEIIRMIESGFDVDNYTVIPDRKAAIEKAVLESGCDSAVVLIGKGHEDYIIDSDGRHPFSEKSIVEDILKKTGIHSSEAGQKQKTVNNEDKSS